VLVLSNMLDELSTRMSTVEVSCVDVAVRPWQIGAPAVPPLSLEPPSSIMLLPPKALEPPVAPEPPVPARVPAPPPAAAVLPSSGRPGFLPPPPALHAAIVVKNSGVRPKKVRSLVISTNRKPKKVTPLKRSPSGRPEQIGQPQQSTPPQSRASMRQQVTLPARAPISRPLRRACRFASKPEQRRAGAFGATSKSAGAGT